ncbi:MAG: hypothetical protein RLZZ28_2633 [Bacteroidota bacterium]|jgi:hypothetical protein
MSLVPKFCYLYYLSNNINFNTVAYGCLGKTTPFAERFFSMLPYHHEG